MTICSSIGICPYDMSHVGEKRDVLSMNARLLACLLARSILRYPNGCMLVGITGNRPPAKEEKLGTPPVHPGSTML